MISRGLNDEDATGRVMRDAVWDTSEKATTTLHATIPHHEEVCSDLVRELAQDFGRTSDARIGLDRWRDPVDSERAKSLVSLLASDLLLY